MPTKRRSVSSTGVYHVTARGINKEQIFNQIRERYYFKKILIKYLKQYDVEICAYCIMSNHIHLIIHSEIETLSLFMARVLAEYASYYNYKHERNGHVFQNRFGSECIETSHYFWNCVRYIHMNSVNAKIVKDICTFIDTADEIAIDCGILVLSMHALWELSSKADIYESLKGYLAFLKEA